LEPCTDLADFAQKDPYFPELGFDKVYLINLKRRPDRLRKMVNILGILGIQFQLVEAVDGK